MMTVNDFRRTVAEMTDLPASVVSRILYAAAELTTKELAAGHVVVLPALGMLQPKVVAAHTGRNPRTGGAIDVPEKLRVKFKASAALARAL